MLQAGDEERFPNREPGLEAFSLVSHTPRALKGSAAASPLRLRQQSRRGPPARRVRAQHLSLGCPLCPEVQSAASVPK